VIGYNPEMADFSNRNGAIHGYAAYISASNDYGDTRQLFIDSSRCEADVVEKAEKLAKNLTTRFEVLGKLPIGFDNWAEGRARYGSDAWIYYGFNPRPSLLTGETVRAYPVVAEGVFHVAARTPCRCRPGARGNC